MRLDLVFGLLLGFVFLLSMKSLINQIRYKIQSKKTGMSVYELTPHRVTTDSKLIKAAYNSKFYQFIRFLLTLIVVVLVLACFSLLLYINTTEYGVFLRYKY